MAGVEKSRYETAQSGKVGKHFQESLAAGSAVDLCPMGGQARARVTRPISLEPLGQRALANGKVEALSVGGPFETLPRRPGSISITDTDASAGQPDQGLATILRTSVVTEDGLQRLADPGKGPGRFEHEHQLQPLDDDLARQVSVSLQVQQGDSVPVGAQKTGNQDAVRDGPVVHTEDAHGIQHPDQGRQPGRGRVEIAGIQAVEGQGPSEHSVRRRDTPRFRRIGNHPRRRGHNQQGERGPPRSFQPLRSPVGPSRSRLVSRQMRNRDTPAAWVLFRSIIT